MILNLSGGGGGLNFKVVGGTTAPSSPTENTIWINTSNEITGWEFSASEPSSPVNGMVWINTGVTSTVKMNAVKNNCIHVYPIGAKQRVNNAWVKKEAKSYQNNKWNDWCVILLDNNGFNSPFSCVTRFGSNPSGGSFSASGNSLSIATPSTGTESSGLGCMFLDAYDLTYFSKVEIYVNSNSLNTTNNSYCRLIAGNTDGIMAAYADIGSRTGTITMDVTSLTGKHIIGFEMYNNGTGSNATVNVTYCALKV